jgi:hypothetical protein
MEHEINSDGKIFEVIASGEATPQGMIDLFQNVLNNNTWEPGCGLIIDFRELANLNTQNMDFPSLSSIASFMKKNEDQFDGTKVAALLRDTMNSKVLFGLLKSLNEFYGSHLEHDIFTSHSSAVKWVKPN